MISTFSLAAAVACLVAILLIIAFRKRKAEMRLRNELAQTQPEQLDESEFSHTSPWIAGGRNGRFPFMDGSVHSQEIRSTILMSNLMSEENFSTRSSHDSGTTDLLQSAEGDSPVTGSHRDPGNNHRDNGNTHRDDGNFGDRASSGSDYNNNDRAEEENRRSEVERHGSGTDSGCIVRMASDADQYFPDDVSVHGGPHANRAFREDEEDEEYDGNWRARQAREGGQVLQAGQAFGDGQSPGRPTEESNASFHHHGVGRGSDPLGRIPVANRSDFGGIPVAVETATLSVADSDDDDEISTGEGGGRNRVGSRRLSGGGRGGGGGGTALTSADALSESQESLPISVMTGQGPIFTPEDENNAVLAITTRVNAF